MGSYQPLRRTEQVGLPESQGAMDFRVRHTIQWKRNDLFLQPGRGCVFLDRRYDSNPDLFVGFGMNASCTWFRRYTTMSASFQLGSLLGYLIQLVDDILKQKRESLHPFEHSMASDFEQEWVHRQNRKNTIRSQQQDLEPGDIPTSPCVALNFKQQLEPVFTPRQRNLLVNFTWFHQTWSQLVSLISVSFRLIKRCWRDVESLANSLHAILRSTSSSLFLEIEMIMDIDDLKGIIRNQY